MYVHPSTRLTPAPLRYGQICRQLTRKSMIVIVRLIKWTCGSLCSEAGAGEAQNVSLTFEKNPTEKDGQTFGTAFAQDICICDIYDWRDWENGGEVVED